MATRSTKQSSMCCVSIDYVDFLLPVDKGMRLVELLQNAVRCQERYADGKIYYVDSKQPEISMTIIKASQVRPAPLPDAEQSPHLLSND